MDCRMKNTPSIYDYPTSEEEFEAPPKVSISRRGRTKKQPDLDMRKIETLGELAKYERQVIEFLRSRDDEVSDSIAQHARQIIERFRRETLQNQQIRCKSSDGSKGHQQPFDRLIYLLDRYTDYCTSIQVSPWPIHYMKVAIWIKNDVISLKTRVRPLRKTVRCYCTTMESVRTKTQHLFPTLEDGEQKPLMTYQVLKDLLDVLPITRSFNLDGNGTQAEMKDFGGLDREIILSDLRKQSGDSKALEAFAIVQASRNRTNNPHGKLTRKKPDPHIHTLNRYQRFCRNAGIPIWPIEPIRVSLWLRDSVLSAASPDYIGFKVSLRTVQVYLSRLEYSRQKTESLFKDEFKEATTPLYRSPAVCEILDSFSPHHKQAGLADPYEIKKYPQSEETGAAEDNGSGILGEGRVDRDDYSMNEDSQEIYTSRHLESSHMRLPGCHEAFGVSTYGDLDSEDEGHAPSYLSRPRSRSCSSSVQPSSIFDLSSSPQFCSRKGRISYILCSDAETSPGSTHAATKQQAAFSSEASVTREHFSPPDWSVSPLTIPRSEGYKPRFMIPSFDSFSFALSK